MVVARSRLHWSTPCAGLALMLCACSSPDASGLGPSMVITPDDSATSPSGSPAGTPGPGSPVPGTPNAGGSGPSGMVPGPVPTGAMPTASGTPIPQPGAGGQGPGPIAGGGSPSLPPTGVDPTGTAGAPPSGGGTGPGGSAPVPGPGGMDNGGAATIGGAGNVGGQLGVGGSANPPMDVIPTLSGTDYSLVLPSATLVANGPTGRITQLVVGGNNRLTTSALNGTNYGSSFWTSPQAVWGWPPPLDAVSQDVMRMDYQHGIEGNAIVLTAPATAQGTESVSIGKRLWADATRDALVLEYTITNTGGATISVAPWEITRMVPQGLTFYPTGTSVAADPIPTTDVGGVTWIDYAAGGISNGAKNIADGAEGWLAHVSGGVLFVKVFPEIPAASAAPAEGEIEIYVDSPTTYVELEQQGAYAPLQAGATTAPWVVVWAVRSVPAEIQATAGNGALVDWVRTVVSGL